MRETPPFGIKSTIKELNRFLNGLDELGVLSGELAIDIIGHPRKYRHRYNLIDIMTDYAEMIEKLAIDPDEKQKRLNLLYQASSEAYKRNWDFMNAGRKLDKDIGGGYAGGGTDVLVDPNISIDEILENGRPEKDDRPASDRQDSEQQGDGQYDEGTQLEGVAKKYQSKAGGLNDKGRAHYKKKGHNLKKPVSKGQAKKSKKSAGRRKSFCSRMGGQKKMHNIDCRADPDKAICKSLKRWDCNEAFDKALDGALGLTEGAGGHEYRNLTSNSFEKRLEKANKLAGSNSGRLYYNQLNKNRQDLIKQAETKRPLRKSEYINLYGYEEWLQYCLDNDIPENSKYTLPDAK
ncbi:DUF6321 domain-containing protein [bacterium]|nr:DUF6321 domain-containing protein [bacterium]